MFGRSRGANAFWISSGSLAKSSTTVSSLFGQVRFSRDRVCTALTPPSFLSTYIVCRSGWSYPVWNLLATIRKRYSSRLKVSAVWVSPIFSSGVLFMPDSV